MGYARGAEILILSVGWSILVVQCANDIIKKLKKYKFDKEQDKNFKEFKCWLDNIDKNSESANSKKLKYWTVVQKNLG